MYFLNIFFFCAALQICGSETTKKHPRFLTFNPDQDDISVGLDFSIPFLRIPLKKFDASTEFGLPGLSLPKINVNPSALAISGFLLVLTSLLAPLFNNALTGWHPDYRTSRDAGLESLMGLEIAETIMTHSRGCPQRIACWLSQKSSVNSLSTWKQLLRNELLTQMVNTTKLVNATARGLKGQNCEAYGPCPIKGENLPNLISSFNTLKHL